MISIIKRLTSPQGEDNKDITIWLKAIRSQVYTEFSGRTKAAHKIFRDISNKIKHGHVSIKTLTVENHSREDVRGFYVCSIIGDNDLRGPDNDIHKPYYGCATAFSYNHFILYSIGCIFEYTNHLNKILFKKQSTSKRINNDITKILLCQNLQHAFFPDEYSKPYAFIKEQKDGRIILKYPHRYKPTKKEVFQNIYSVKSAMDFNQRTCSSHAKLPYLQLTRKRW